MPTATSERFAESADAFDRAEHMRRYTHRTWAVWQAGEWWFTGRCSKEVIEEAAASGKVYLTGPDGITSVYRNGSLAILLKNARGGYMPI